MDMKRRSQRPNDPLGLMTWTFARIARAAPELAATIDPAGWQERGGLLVWEAFVAGATKQKAHTDGAMIALKAFTSRWPDLRSDIPVEAAVNLAVAAACPPPLRRPRRDRSAIHRDSGIP